MKTLVVAVAGGALTLVGLALLVLPGPGFVLIAAGLSILATRFDWAAGPLQYARGKAQAGIDEVGRSLWRALASVGAASGLALVGVLALAGVAVPLVGTVSAVLLVGSGVFLLGTVLHARRSAVTRGSAN